MTTITKGQYEKMVEASMALVPLYPADYRENAYARVSQMLARAGIDVAASTTNKHRDNTLERRLIVLKEGDGHMVLVEVEPDLWLVESDSDAYLDNIGKQETYPDGFDDEIAMLLDLKED